jgi:hypothetical protein
MEDELTEIIKILKKVLPRLIEHPSMMEGCDVSHEEIKEIIKTKQLPLEILKHLAGDTFLKYTSMSGG